MTNREKFKSIQERSDAFRGFCRSRRCQNCELDATQDNIECAYTWLDLEAEEEKPDECPFCGGRIDFHNILVENGKDWFVLCKACKYTSGRRPSRDEAIAAHNELCRKVKGVGK